jgi:hypothetical protein
MITSLSPGRLLKLPTPPAQVCQPSQPTPHSAQHVYDNLSDHLALHSARAQHTTGGNTNQYW